jgi:hypothetical protein
MKITKVVPLIETYHPVFFIQNFQTGEGHFLIKQKFEQI